MRDPQALGEAYLKARQYKAPIGDAVHMPAPNVRTDETPIDKYGKPGQAGEVWERIRVK